MKKIIYTVLLLTSIFSSVCFAKGDIQVPHACYYTDYFHLDSNYAKALLITRLTHDTNVVVDQKDPNSFYIKDTESCPSGGGYAYVRYQKSRVAYCDLTFHDAEDMLDPEVTAVCTDSLHYSGIKYDGVSSFSYTLLFY